MRVILLIFLSGVTALASPLVESAKKQIGVTTQYDPSYQSLDFPNGDVDPKAGVCTDVVIRALRDAHQYDLQSKVHSDMKNHFSQYPKIWGLKRTDRNIDHRRVPNLRKFFLRQGFSLGIHEKSNDAFQAGDIVTCVVPPNQPHIMIVSDRKNSTGVPYVIHNIGSGTSEDDCLLQYKLTGHYRFSK